MTGFGQGSATGEGYEATVEIRTVNSRFCEVSIRGPRELNAREAQIQREIKSTISRGRVTVNVQLDRTTIGDIGLTVNEDAVLGYRKLIEQVGRTAAIADERITLDHLLKFQDIFVSEKQAAEDPEVLWAPVSAALLDSLDALKAMRLAEGAALSKELKERARSISERLALVREMAPSRIPAARVRVRERLDEIIQEGRLDADRLEQEMAFLADKLDITEECVRLDAHMIAFQEALDSSEPVGRKLNFLAQEINREVNTIGSKANDADIALVVVGMKEDLEKIREQIENIE
jgi:uncharacterized protein (TIGR00255 family)